MVAQIIEIFSMRANLLMILGMGLVEQFSKMVDTIMVSGNETGEMAQEERSDSTKRRKNGLKRRDTGKMISLRRTKDYRRLGPRYSLGEMG